MKHARPRGIFEQLKDSGGDKVRAYHVNRPCWLTGNHRREASIEKPYRVVDRVEAAHSAGGRIADDDAESNQNQRELIHRLPDHLLHFGLRLLVTVDEAVPRVTVVRLGEVTSTFPAYIHSAQERAALQ